MSAKQVIVIRHAQKPTSHPKHLGVREDGTRILESLTVAAGCMPVPLPRSLEGRSPTPSRLIWIGPILSSLLARERNR